MCVGGGGSLPYYKGMYLLVTGKLPTLLSVVWADHSVVFFDRPLYFGR